MEVNRSPTLWANSYFVSTVGGAPLSIIKQYIEGQKEIQMPGSHTPSFVVELSLKISPCEEKKILKAFEAGRYRNGYLIWNGLQLKCIIHPNDKVISCD